MEFGVTVGDSPDRLEATAGSFEFAEFGLGEGGPAVEAGRLEAATTRADVDLCVHLPFKQVVSTPVPEINEAIVAHQSRLLDWAGTLGARKAVLHASVRDPYDTDQREPFAAQVEAILAAGERAGVEVVLENVGHQRSGLQLSVLGDIAADLGAPVCFDVGHAYMEEGNNGVKRFLGRHADLVSHLHAHDARRRGDTHIPVGAGDVDFGAVADRLGEFDGTVAVEVFTDDVAHLRDSAERVAAALGGSVDG
jgi:sugar phosphate isomerase/epimerase